MGGPGSLWRAAEKARGFMPRIKTAAMPQIKMMTFHLLLGFACSAFGKTVKGQFHMIVDHMVQSGVDNLD